jgi:hypothetical protein
LNVEDNEEIVECEDSDEDISRYFSDDNDVKEVANNQISNLEHFADISEEDINQIEIKGGIIIFKYILQNLLLMNMVGFIRSWCKKTFSIFRRKT